MVPPHLGGHGGLRRARADARRPSGDRAAEPLGGGDAALGLPVRRHHHHPGQLARQGRRNRLLRREFRSESRGVRGGVGGRPCANRAKRKACRASRSARRRPARSPSSAARARGARRRAARRRRRLVGDALHLRHHGQAEGRAAPPARRTRRRRRPCGAEPLRPRRTHARRDAALSHHGRALAARHVADRRHLRLPAALRGERRRWS